MLIDPKTGQRVNIHPAEKIPAHIREVLEPDYKEYNAGFFSLGVRARFLTFSQKASAFKNKH